MRYARELRLADPLTIDVEVLWLHATTLALRLAFFRDPDEPIGLGHQRLVLTDRDGRPIKIPDDLRRQLEPFLVGESDGLAA